MSIKAFGVFVICSLRWITRFKCVFSLFSTLVVLTSSFGMRLMTLLGFAVMMLCMRLLFPLNKKGLTITTGKFFKVRYFKDLPWVGRYRRFKKALYYLYYFLVNITSLQHYHMDHCCTETEQFAWSLSLASYSKFTVLDFNDPQILERGYSVYILLNCRFSVCDYLQGRA